MSQFAPTQPDTLEKQCRYFSIHRNIVGGITTRFTIKGRAGDLLGWVRWYGRWRMWCFLPCEGSVWSADCLADVCKFVAGLNAKVPQNRDKAVSNSESPVNSGNQLTDGESDKAK